MRAFLYTVNVATSPEFPFASLELTLGPQAFVDKYLMLKQAKAFINGEGPAPDTTGGALQEEKVFQK